MNYTELSLESLREVSINAAKNIKEEVTIDLIIYVARAGLPIAIYMNEIFQAEILGIGAQRKGNKVKSFLGPIISRMPLFMRNFLISLELKTKVHKHDTERHVAFHESISNIRKSEYQNILIVDDSIDTGNSLVAVLNEVKKEFTTSQIYTYGLNVWDGSKELVKTDFCSYENTIIKAPMSKDSSEYKSFCEMYKKMTRDDYI